MAGVIFNRLTITRPIGKDWSAAGCFKIATFNDWLQYSQQASFHLFLQLPLKDIILFMVSFKLTSMLNFHKTLPL